MNAANVRFRAWSSAGAAARIGSLVFAGLLALALGLPAQQPAQPSPAQQPDASSAPQQPAQQPATPDAGQQPAQPGTTQQPPAPGTNPAPDAGQQPAPSPSTGNQAAPAQAPAAAPAENPPASAPEPAPATPAQSPTPAPAAASSSPETAQGGGITEEELKQLLVGKSLYLRGGYLDNNLSFGEHGQLISHSPQGSYTLSGVEIDKVHLTKHKVELDGVRYGLHFLGALPYEDPTKAVDRVRITPKKKSLKITIDRELVITPKKKKKKEEKAKALAGTPANPAAAGAGTAPPAQQAAAPAAAPEVEISPEDQAKAEMAAAPAEERPADPGSVTTTTSPAHAKRVLQDALDHIFAPGLDDRIMAAMPDFWKLYYQAVAAKSDYRPSDPTVLRQNAVDEKAKLLSNFEPESNDFAQASGVAGMALYHTVIGPDGRPGEIAVARPIGFGLDENAVAAIRKASFQPAMKEGKPVPVMLDLVVQFRIYSKRTAVAGKPDAGKTAEPVLPGPYSVRHQ